MDFTVLAPLLVLLIAPACGGDDGDDHSDHAVGPDGRLNGGRNTVGNPGGDCRFMGNANTYVRSACDNTWCAYVYALYFEKDQGIFAAHRHDWENVVVWQRRGQEVPTFVSASAHGGYHSKWFNQIERDGNRAKIVYHLDGAATHAFRFAKKGEKAEAWGNGNWDRPNLVALDRLRSSYRKAFDALWTSNWVPAGLKDGANFPLQDAGDHFATALNRSRENIAKDLGQSLSFAPNIRF